MYAVMVPFAEPITLQWSRANDGAETALPYGLDLLLNRLQWSRANDGAETLFQLAMAPHTTPASMEPRQ